MNRHVNFAIRRIYNGCFTIDINVIDTNQKWEVLIQKSDVIFMNLLLNEQKIQLFN